MKRFSAPLLTFILMGSASPSSYASCLIEEADELSSSSLARKKLFTSPDILRRSLNLHSSVNSSEDESLSNKTSITQSVRDKNRETLLERIQGEKQELLLSLDEERKIREEQEQKLEKEKTKRLSLKERAKQAGDTLILQISENERLGEELTQLLESFQRAKTEGEELQKRFRTLQEEKVQETLLKERWNKDFLDKQEELDVVHKREEESLREAREKEENFLALMKTKEHKIMEQTEAIEKLHYPS